ncbi:MAG: site-2 protease family protein [Nitrospira bacterium HGW-Nitrospira-1]|nr:MAG: site-2 protease family protein [Nitrospira bacterium HGW-Nitrospira-1]
MRKIPYLNIVLFVLTFISTLTVGAMHEGINVVEEPLKIYKGSSFSITLLLILLFHEFSHYLASKKHRIEASLPYFIPAPTLFGTFGAVIKMKAPITTKNALMDIGASGPIAGFIISVAATIIGLSFSKIMPAHDTANFISLGDSLLFSGLTRAILGTIPDNYNVFLHPVAFAGWIGFFVTSINLIPVGQLDGGHILYALAGEKHAAFSKLFIGVMFIMGFLLWDGWIIWGVLLIILGFRHPPVVYSEMPLAPKRKLIGWISLVIFVLTFTPIPVIIAQHAK